MTPIQKLPIRFDVTGVQKALEKAPELWDQHPQRTSPKDSPHHELSDIWARFAEPNTGYPDGSHDSMWYQPNSLLPVRDIVYGLMTAVRGDRLGGVLITRIKPGQMCKPHTDSGWHARYYEKYAVQIASAPEQAFHFHGHELVTEPGDVFWFDNSHEHWVTNNSDSDRITMIVCIRTERN